MDQYTAREIGEMAQIERVKAAIRPIVHRFVVMGEFALADIAKAAIAALKEPQ